MTKTAKDISNKALVYIRQLASDETADGITMQDALDEYESVHEQLVVDAKHNYGVRSLYWSKDAVPNTMMPLVASILAVELLKPFSTAQNSISATLAFGDAAETKFWKRMQTGRSKQPRYPNFPTNYAAQGTATIN